jgi:hypothetical protein
MFVFDFVLGVDFDFVPPRGGAHVYSYFKGKGTNHARH